jgi:hypothetical protein
MPNVDFGAYAGYVEYVSFLGLPISLVLRCFDSPTLPDAQEKYWGTNLPRLEQIKKAVDPNDVFHNPQSVRPAE